MLLVMAVLWIYFHQMQSMQDLSRSSINTVSKMDLVASLIETARRRTRLTNEMLHTDDLFARDEINLQLDIEASRFAKQRTQLQQMELNNAEKQILKDQNSDILLTLEAQRKATDLAMTEDLEQIATARNILIFQVYPGQGRIIDHFLRLLALQKQQLTEESELALRNAEISSNYQIVLFVVVVLGMVVVITITMRRSRNELDRHVALRAEELNRSQRILAEVREKNELTNRVNRDFLTNISRQIRTPLQELHNAITAIVVAELSLPFRSKMSNAQQLSESLLTTVTTNLDYAQLSVGTLQLQLLPFDIHTDVIDAAIETVAQQARKKHLPIEVDCDPLLCYIGDAARIRQVVVNMLANSLHRTESGSVGVQVTVDRLTTPHSITIAVVDSGTAMSQQQLDTLLQPSTQSDAESLRLSSDDDKGTFICRKLVEVMDGTVRVHNTDGGSVTVAVTIPLEAEKEVTPLLQPLAKIMLLDGDLHRAGLQRSLFSYFASACEQYGLVSACQRLQTMGTKREYDLVVADVDTINAAFLQTLEQIVSTKRPALIITAFSVDDIPEWIDMTLVSAVLLKPYYRTAIAKAVDNAMVQLSTNAKTPSV